MQRNEDIGDSPVHDGFEYRTELQGDMDSDENAVYCCSTQCRNKFLTDPRLNDSPQPPPRCHNGSLCPQNFGNPILRVSTVTQPPLPHSQGSLASVVNDGSIDYEALSINTFCALCSTKTVENGYSRRRICPSSSMESSSLYRPRSCERYLIIDIGNSPSTNEQFGPIDPEPGLEVVQTSYLTRLLLMVLAMLLKATSYVRTLVRQKQRPLLRILVMVVAIVGAPTCVSVMSSKGTNSLLITIAVSAILMSGKFLFDMLAEGHGTRRQAFQNSFWDAGNGAMSFNSGMIS